MFLCTFASCFDLTTHPSSSRSAEAAAIVQDTRQEKTRPARMLTFSITRSRATRSADQNVAARAYFEGTSNTEAPAACRSHAVHVHGTSRLPARGRCTPSDVTSRVGAVRATSRRGASGGITGVVGAVRRRLPTRGPARRQYLFYMVLKCVDLLTPARGALDGLSQNPRLYSQCSTHKMGSSAGPRGQVTDRGKSGPPDRGPYPP